MTALSKSYRIPNFNAVSETVLNDQFFLLGTTFFAIDNQSTIFKEKGSLSHTNKLSIQKIRQFSELKRNWDSYDAQEIHPNAILKAIELVEEVDSLDEDVHFASPGPNGEIMIQLKKKQKEVELIVYKEKSIFVTFKNNEFEKQGSFSSDLLPHIVEWLNQ